jgi:mRNA-degrading endonuclease RelE of RelBE toxin-antitoxin system
MDNENETKQWTVIFSRKAEKQKNKLPSDIADNLYILQRELENSGPYVPSWSHFGKLGGSKSTFFHCHLNKGRPTYVVVWQIVDKFIRILEIQFIGTHEKVNYSNYI